MATAQILQSSIALDSLRLRGKSNFTVLPTPRDEQWKYTSLKFLHDFDLMGETQQPAPQNNQNVVSLLQHKTMRPVADQMVFADMDALPRQVTLLSLQDAAQHQPQLLERALGILADAAHPFVALNDQHLSAGLFLHIPADMKLSEPLELFFMDDGSRQKSVSHPRLVIILERGAEATIVEHHMGQGQYVRNSVSEIDLGPGARLQHYRLQNDSLEAAHLSYSAVKAARDAHYDHFTLTLGGALARQEVDACLDDNNAQVNLNAAHLIGGNQHSDTTTRIHHNAPHCRSRQTVKYALRDKAHGVFQGRIHVDQSAQKTDGYQMNQALLLSDQAEINAKPELEIFADDVKCSHGATIGQLDKQALFYLRSRGVPEAEARALLIQSFIGGAIEEIENEMVRDVFMHLAQNHLQNHAQENGLVV